MDKNFPRLLDTLRLIPRSRKASTADIHRQLAALGHEVSRRTVQRDLEALASHYGFQCDDRDSAYGWWWPDRSVNPLAPEVDLPQALALMMMNRELGALMPAAASESLAPWLDAARRKAASSGQARASRWLRKLAFQELGPPLLPAKISSSVLDGVVEALFAEVQITAEYRSAQADGYRRAKLNPLGLIRTGLVSYLAVRFDGYEDVRLLALHRMRRIQLLTEASVAPVGFDLQEFARQGGLDFGEGPTRRVRLQMTCEAAAHLQDTPLSSDQTIEPWTENLDWVIVTATVRDSPRLQWWIRGFGDQARRLE